MPPPKIEPNSYDQAFQIFEEKTKEDETKKQ
jgi:hypothetical protein